VTTTEVLAGADGDVHSGDVRVTGGDIEVAV